VNKKVRIARWSIISNTALIAMKLVVGLISGSVSIISEAIHSAMDLLAALIAFFSVKVSDNPPDSRHPYGHGKFENISGVIEAVLIFIASMWIIYEAVHKLLSVSRIDSIWIGCAVMFVSAMVNSIISRKLYKVAHETDSVALEADALHLKADVFTSLGVGTGLLLIKITGLHFLDPIIAIMVALFIIVEAYNLLKHAYSPLLDNSLPQYELDIIDMSIRKYTKDYHNLRTRKSGKYKFIDFHMEISEDLSVKSAHDLCDTIEEEIKSKIRSAEVTIHVETPEKIN
jgi:cation diffusion facilitator family transporter